MRYTHIATPKHVYRGGHVCLFIAGCLLQPFLSVPLSHILPCFGPWEGFQRGTCVGWMGQWIDRTWPTRVKEPSLWRKDLQMRCLDAHPVGDKTVKFQHAGRSPRISKVLEKPCWRFSSAPRADIMTSWHRTSQSRSQAGGGHPLWHRGGLLKGIQGWLDVWASCGMGTLGNVGNTYKSQALYLAKEWWQQGGGEHVQLVSSILTAFRSESTMVRICKNLLLR